jgi:hypothetical protein
MDCSANPFYCELLAAPEPLNTYPTMTNIVNHFLRASKDHIPPEKLKSTLGSFKGSSLIKDTHPLAVSVKPSQHTIRLSSDKEDVNELYEKTKNNLPVRWSGWGNPHLTEEETSVLVQAVLSVVCNMWARETGSKLQVVSGDPRCKCPDGKDPSHAWTDGLRFAKVFDSQAKRDSICADFSAAWFDTEEDDV